MAEIEQGVAEWRSMKLSYEDDKIMITKSNIFHRLSTYRLNASPESDNDFLSDMVLLETGYALISKSPTKKVFRVEHFGPDLRGQM